MMSMISIRSLILRSSLLLVGVGLLANCATAQEHLEKLGEGSVELKFAGPMAFGADGVLFIGDPVAASVHALDTGDRESGQFTEFSVEGIDAKVAAALGTDTDGIRINDLAVNPVSGTAYLSVNRGDAGIILKVGSDGSLSELDLKSIRHATAAIPNAPGQDAKDRRGRPLRMMSITDISLIDNQVVVAGLSNEDFASNLRAIPYPFSEDIKGTALEVYHGAHGKYETNAPVRTFAGITLDDEPFIVAAYTCTPLVRFPLSEVTSGEKIRGTTVAELGNWNNPLDMFAYEKDGEKFILMANTARGMMKISTANMATVEGITERVSKEPGIAGQSYETIEDLKTAVQLDRFGDHHAMVILKDEKSGKHDLKVVPLP